MKNYEELTGLYQLAKTLRFELKPIGKTLENIERKNLIAEDEKRANEYQLVKGIIDRYHKAFIKMCLYDFKLKLESDGNADSLTDYVELASKTKRSENEETEFEKVKKNLRCQIVGAFAKGNSFNDLFKKELIQNHLPEFVTDSKEKDLVEHFNKFTTYFTGFHENRKNMYSSEDKSTAIAYRIIHENLPVFIDNINVFGKIKNTDVINRLVDIQQAFSDYLNVNCIDEMFSLNYFTETLTQEQIEVYNNIIGGMTCEDGIKIQGLNEYINLYNQQQKERSSRLPLLKPLYRMILSDRVAISWLPNEFNNENEMVDAINEMYNTLHNILLGNEGISLRNLLKALKDYDLKKIYIANDLGLTEISQQMFGKYDVFTSGLKDEIRRTLVPTRKEKTDDELFAERINKTFKACKSFSISSLNALPQPENDNKDRKTIENYFSELGAYDRNGDQRIDLFTQLEMNYVAAKEVLSGNHTNINQSENDIKLLKDLLDSFKAIQHFIKPLLGSGDEIEKDNTFDAQLIAIWNALDIVTPLYNKVRNWLTRKPYTDEKIKLNFENAQLLSGWDVNKETDCTSVLFKKEENYYLAIMDKSANHAFDYDGIPSDGECYEKMVYKQMALPMGFGAFVRKCFGTAKQYGWSCPKSCLNKDQKIIIKDDEAQGILVTLIDCYKDFLSKYEKDGFKYSSFGFKFKETSDYNKLSDFFTDVANQGFKLYFRPISVSFIDQLVNDGKLYLFQIWNKDFSIDSKGRDNLHTMYWKALFSESNLNNLVYKLNGQAEVFYRKKSINIANTTVHKAEQPIANKNTLNNKKESVFTYDIIKNRRYTIDKFQFHVPITINFKAKGNDFINTNVHEIIRYGGIEHVIGIDRGERHLLYLSLIDLKGNIIKQMTLNEIVNEYKGNTYSTNYRDLLASREGDRDEARRNWQKIENIKEIKEGYLSQVIHIIAKMMVEYKAIVVLEDLNMGFIRGRQKIERQVYEKFEKMLIDKLNYYVDKQKPADEIGGLLHAMQLANKFVSFKKLGKQSGCLFYIPAWNTSKIDPTTGFVNLLDTRYENADKVRLFFSKFDSIRYNKEKDWFEFTLDYDKFGDKAKGTQTKWLLCTYGTRIRTFRNPKKNYQWDNEEVVLTKKFKEDFANAGIDINGNIKNAIASLTDKKYLEPLMGDMKLLLQMRNSVTGTEEDYLLSPVADENGNFYDSRKAGNTLPQDADANGAYNIARKGLWAVRKIKATAQGEKVNLAISNKEWLQFAQQKPYLDD